jgi:hypothetical protein
LDALGKWSLLDSYVLVAMMVAFNFKVRGNFNFNVSLHARGTPISWLLVGLVPPRNQHYRSISLLLAGHQIYLGPDHSGLPGGEAIRVTIFTVPGYGFYAFMLATMVSLAVGHAATFFHRFAASPVARVPAGGPREALCRHAFRTEAPHTAKAAEKAALQRESRFHFTHLDRVVASSDRIEAETDEAAAAESWQQGRVLSASKRWGVACLIVLTSAVLVAAAIQRSYQFTFGGLVGWLLDSPLVGPGSSPRQQGFSLLSTYNVLPSAAPVPDDLGIHFIQTAFIGYALLVPLAHLALLLVAWLVPTTLRTQAFLLVAGEVANAWSAVDVFIVSLFAALLQIGQFCAFIVSAPCGSPVDLFGGQSLNDLIGAFFESRGIEEDPSCLTVSASLVGGCFSLVAAGLSVFCTSQLVLGYAHAAVHDRLDDLLRADTAALRRPSSSAAAADDDGSPGAAAQMHSAPSSPPGGGGSKNSGDESSSAFASSVASEPLSPLRSAPRREGL